MKKTPSPSFDALMQFLYGHTKGCFFHTAGTRGTDRTSYLFINPVHTVCCNSAKDIESCFDRIEQYSREGYYAAGYFSYELGYHIEKKFDHLSRTTTKPLFTVGIYEKPITFTDLNIPQKNTGRSYWLHSIRRSETKQEYIRKFNAIKHYIAEGDVYQINYCFKLYFDCFGNYGSLFADLLTKQSVAYAAYFKDNKQHIISLSPEMYFHAHDQTLTLKPMKGTLLKTSDRAQDFKRLKQFQQSEKNQAENLMIVDLIRNDASKISQLNSVHVPHLFSVEEYDTLYQMTSTIGSTLKKNVSLLNYFKALFPSGSVTGAPKIRAMEIIRELENSPRGVYTGTMGFIAPHKKIMSFNIPIRTLMLDTKNHTGEMGIGSGIVYDSNPVSEFEECLGKARFLTRLEKKHSLIETILLQKNTHYFLLDQHLERLQQSADFFNIPCNTVKLKRILHETARKSDRKKQYKVRVLLSHKGIFSVKTSILVSNPTKQEEVAVCAISGLKTDHNDIFLQHKTTHRTLYDQEFRKYQKKGYADVLFFNTKGELTEGAISNVIIEKDGIFYTPPIECGILPGIYRDFLLNKDQKKYTEKKLARKDIDTADAIYICNSVRKMQRIQIR